MKSGLFVIHISLLTILLTSSFILYLSIVSGAIQIDDANGSIDSSGLFNVSFKSTKNVEAQIQKTPNQQDSLEKVDQIHDNHKITFTDAVSLNTVTTDELPDAGLSPVIITLEENKLDVSSTEELLFADEPDQQNQSKTFSTAENNSQTEETSQNVVKVTEPHLVVQAKSMHEIRHVDEIFATTPSENESYDDKGIEEENVSDNKSIPLVAETAQEDIPSFSEWSQKQLAEAEKKHTVLNNSSPPNQSSTNSSAKNAKLRSKNYASPACGAKVVAVNPEAGTPSFILSPNKDEYMLNTCNSRIWFIVELCEAVQAQKIELANFELFSSRLKDFAVYFSDRYPTRDWASVGHFTAQDSRDIQSFDLYPHLFGKFIKVEILSHYGSEHYCPISVFKVYGTSEFEVLEKESSQHPTQIDDDDDEIIDVPDISILETEERKNLFGSARDAVMSIVKKAAQALVKTEVPKNSSETYNNSSNETLKNCVTPSHNLICDMCSAKQYDELFKLISCEACEVMILLHNDFILNTLQTTSICNPIGINFEVYPNLDNSDKRATYIYAFFPNEYVAALCNLLAVENNILSMNTSTSENMNATNITLDQLPVNVNTVTSSEADQLEPHHNLSINQKVVETVQLNVTLDLEDNVESGKVVDEKEEKEKTESVHHEPYTNPILSHEEAKEIDNNYSTIDKDKVIEPSTDTIKIGKDEDKRTDNNSDKLNNPRDELNNQIIIDSDSFMSEIDQMAIDPTPTGSSPSQNQQQTFQKESVFLRLSNRVKTLERNMSLSGQYLEELSRRYKKQVEEMQKTFEKTVLQMTEERRKSNERENKYVEEMGKLQERLADMTTLMKILMEDRDSWFGSITFFKFVIYQTIVALLLIYYMSKKFKRTSEASPPPLSRRARKRQERIRRKSVEGVSGHETPAQKKRRPSEEALHIARLSEGVDDDDGEWQVARKNRKRKTSVFDRSGEMKIEWEHENLRTLCENPPLDEEEFVAPVSEPKNYKEVTAKAEPPQKRNGSLFGSFKTAKVKTRRLSSPAFLRTFSRQNSNRMEPIFNGNVEENSCESPTSSLWSQSTETSNTVNGLARGKKRKSFKNILKKVF